MLQTDAQMHLQITGLNAALALVSTCLLESNEMNFRSHGPLRAKLYPALYRVGVPHDFFEHLAALPVAAGQEGHVQQRAHGQHP